MPALEPQTYKPSPTFNAVHRRPSRPSTGPRWRRTRSRPCRAEKLVAAGFLADGQSFIAFANSKGNFGYQQSTEPRLHLHRAHRRRARLGLGRPQRRATSASSTPRRDIRIAMRKAAGSADAKALEPGKYTVILEPAAAAGLITFMMFGSSMRARPTRAAASCRRRAAATGSASRCSTRGSASTPTRGMPTAPVLPWDGDGLPREKHALVDKGKVAQPRTTRATGRKKQGKRDDRPARATLLMAGGTKSTAELVQGHRRRASWSPAPGTSAWSIRRRCC